MGKMSRLGNELYQGRRSIDFVGRRWLIYAVSGVLIALAITINVVKPLNFGVEFTGGTEYNITVGDGEATQDAADQLRDAVGEAGIENAHSPTVTTAGNQALTMQTENLSPEQNDAVREIIFEEFPDIAEGDVSESDIGPSWGQEVAERAVIGVIIFLILVVLFIWAYFREWKMSVAAVVALLHDIAITVGVYALSGFQVTPAAVTGLLAILGFSLYDTVVVFDKVRENTTTLRKSTESYADAANLAVNQTLVRSINTSIVALLPIGAILYISAAQLGASSLQDLALAQFVGMAAGVYSSVMLAPRVLVHLKGGESEIQEQARRAAARRKRIEADRYAAVPAFTDDSPATAAQAGVPQVEIEDDDSFRAETDDEGEPATTRTQAAGRGRVVPEQHRPVGNSNAAGRQQPQRQPRSKRGKK